MYADGGSCSGQSGPCFYTQSALSASPTASSGYTWAVSTTGAGNVTLSCYTNCSSTVTATATHASSGCSADVFIYATYNGVQSSGYGLTLVTPNHISLHSGPIDSDPNNDPGAFQTEYSWSVYDSCGNNDTGIDQTESFGGYGAWTDDYYNNTGTHNTWVAPLAGGAYATTYFYDYMSHSGGSAYVPTTTSPQSPACQTAVMHATWTLYAGSNKPTDCGGSACGASVHTDTFQFYTDCGRHQ